MTSLPPWLVLLVLFCGDVLTAAQGRNTVTNEDIRDAILQVVNVVRATEDKLERHEYRERVLGEQLKKGMISIDKRIKLLDPFKGTISRLDERLAAVETILMQKDERERIQLQRTFETVEDIQKNLPLIVEKLKGDIIEKLADLKSAGDTPIELPTKKQPSISKEDVEKLQRELGAKIDRVADSIKTMELDLVKMKEENKGLKEISNRSSENLDKVKRQLDTSEQLLEKYENKLAEYNNRIPPVPVPDHKDDSEWQANFLQALDLQKANVEQLITDVKAVTGKLQTLPEKRDLEAVQNATLGGLEGIKDETLQQPLKTARLLDGKIQGIHDEVKDKHDQTLRSINEMSEGIEDLAKKFTLSHEDLKGEIQSLSKVEQVMVQTADSVLDTKRRVEYGVHQIISEMQQLSKTASKDVNEAISERFDLFEMSILDEETGALANLTSKIGHEIDQVWRQIGIMHQQMSASTDTLNKLQNQTDAYITGSLGVMDNMKGKVGTITSRITEVDSNLNFLLGKLSLATQEFNQIKSGLGKALDEMRGTYKTIREKIKTDEGPGPHRIESEETGAPKN